MFERRHVERLVRLVDSGALKLGREIGMVSFKEFELEEWEEAAKFAAEERAWAVKH